MYSSDELVSRFGSNPWPVLRLQRRRRRPVGRHLEPRFGGYRVLSWPWPPVLREIVPPGIVAGPQPRHPELRSRLPLGHLLLVVDARERAVAGLALVVLLVSALFCTAALSRDRQHGRGVLCAPAAYSHNSPGFRRCDRGRRPWSNRRRMHRDRVTTSGDFAPSARTTSFRRTAFVTRNDWVLDASPPSGGRCVGRQSRAVFQASGRRASAPRDKPGLPAPVGRAVLDWSGSARSPRRAFPVAASGSGQRVESRHEPSGRMGVAARRRQRVGGRGSRQLRRAGATPGEWRGSEPRQHRSPRRCWQAHRSSPRRSKQRSRAGTPPWRDCC